MARYKNPDHTLDKKEPEQVNEYDNKIEKIEVSNDTSTVQPDIEASKEQEAIPKEKTPSQNRYNENKRRKKRQGLTVGKCVARFFIVMGITLVAVIIFLYGVINKIYFGPSPSARNMLISTVMETSAAKFLATSFFSDEEIETFMSVNEPKQFEEEQDTSIIHIPSFPEAPIDKDNNKNPSENTNENGIEIFTIKTDRYSGKMMIIKDPSRVFVGTAPQLGPGKGGTKLEDMVKNYEAIGGVNGGRFYDQAGTGAGGEPIGFVVTNSNFVYGDDGQKYDLIGFDENDILVVGKMTGKEVKKLKIRDAVSFGPVLVLNGNGAKISGSGGGLNPRTAIGQRADGAVLLLVIDGRQINSLGASYQDLIDIMLEYGAINAANLDGGSSTLMIYKNEILNNCASLYGPRKMPTAFLVK